MKEELVKAIQDAIVLYVAHQEKNRYQGHFSFDLTYIQKSRYVPLRRKQDIAEIHRILSHPHVKDEVELADYIWRYLSTIYTGFSIWFIHFETGNSVLRTNIHHAIFRYDPLLFRACKEGQIKKFALAQRKPFSSSVSEQINEMSHPQLIKLYTNLMEENRTLKIEITSLKADLAKLTVEKLALEKMLQQALEANETLKNKVKRILEQKATREAVETIRLTSI